MDLNGVKQLSLIKRVRFDLDSTVVHIIPKYDPTRSNTEYMIEKFRDKCKISSEDEYSENLFSMKSHSCEYIPGQNGLFMF